MSAEAKKPDVAPESIWNRPLPLPFGMGKRPRVRDVLGKSGLPESLSTLVAAVCRRSRLWRSEQVDTARELASHFRDGLEAGRKEAELEAAFGDPKLAAKLIRRAAKRKRPLWWRAWMRGWQAVGVMFACMLVVMLYAGARYMLLTPTITHNYMKEINAKLLAVPPQERAWPLYLDAYQKLADLGPIPEPSSLLPGELSRSYKPGGEHWPEVAAYIEKAGPAIGLIREGAKRRSMGYLLSSTQDPVLAAAEAKMEGRTPPASGAASPSDENPLLLSVLLPHLSTVRRMGVLVGREDFDAALVARDAERATQDLETAARMAEQLLAGSTLIEQLIGAALARIASESFMGASRSEFSMFDGAQLRRIAHALAAASASCVIDLNVERQMLPDILQRVYSDNGAGDGVVTLSGLRSIGAPGAGLFGLTGVENALVFSPLTAGRKDLLDFYNRIMDEQQAAGRMPLNDPAASAAEAQLDRMARGTVARLRYAPVAMLVPAVGHASRQLQIVAMRLDACTVGIALELYKRNHGAYPEQLSTLVPDLLPSVPPDRFDGKPLRYALKDGKPVVYSVGSNNIDDGGIPSTRPPKEQRSNGTALPGSKPGDQGDFILWPMPE